MGWRPSPTKFMRGHGPAYRGHGYGDLPMAHSPVTVPQPGGGSGCLRAVPEIILGGGTFFFRPLHPQATHGVRAPRPPGHASALINLPHYGSNMP